MREYCRTHSFDTNPPRTRANMGCILVEDHLKIIYCSIPKVGITTWKRILLELRGGKTRQNVCVEHYNRVQCKMDSNYRSTCHLDNRATNTIQYNTIQYSLFNEGDVINPMSYLTYGLHQVTTNSCADL